MHKRTKSLDKYFQDISKFSLLTAEEEIELAIRKNNGCQKSFDKLVQSNLRFVVQVAKQYQNSGMALTDLIAEGNLGLIKAVEKFDETMGFKFISYGVWWIRQAILNALSQNSRVVRIPLNKVNDLNKIKKEQISLANELQREPNIEELENQTNIDRKEIGQIITAASPHWSFDKPTGEESNSNTTLLNVIKNEDESIEEIFNSDLKIVLKDSIKALKHQEKFVIEKYYGLNCELPLTLEQLGDKLGLTRERVRQIRDRALGRLRHNSRKKKIDDFLNNI